MFVHTCAQRTINLALSSDDKLFQRSGTISTVSAKLLFVYAILREVVMAASGWCHQSGVAENSAYRALEAHHRPRVRIFGYFKVVPFTAFTQGIYSNRQ
jgi:hypothetical protein